MYCEILSATEKWTLWGVKSRKNWADTISTGFDGLYDVAAVGDLVLVTATDKGGYLEITGFDQNNRKVDFVEKDTVDFS